MFINIPDNFSSLYDPAVFEYTAPATQEIEIKINDAARDETIGVKKFYSSNGAKVNISPLIFNLDSVEPSFVTTTTFGNDDAGFPLINISVGESKTENVRFTYAKQGALEYPMLTTTMPRNRLLNNGEGDIVTLLTEPNSAVECTIEAKPIGGGVIEYDRISATSGGVVKLHINADSYADEYENLCVTLFCNNWAVGDINYTLSGAVSSGYRVAWLSSRGTIEHYTFPVIVEQVRTNDFATIKSIRSAYGLSDEMRAISEIISSPKVWRVDDSGYHPIEVLTTEQTIRQEGALAIANIKVREND